MRTILLALVLTALAFPALASDGVLEINQTCAVQTGCFEGDDPGFPVTITEPGTSYILTSRLVVPDENTHGIFISPSSISIDLNGFGIIRSGCEFVVVNCTPASGSGSGVDCSPATAHGLSVKNGSITGMGRYGVVGGREAEVTNLRVRWNRLAGISTDFGSIVSGNTASGNGEEGIHAFAGSIVSGNTAHQNGGDGIFAGNGSTVSGNTALVNGGDGIQTGSGSTVSGNTVRFNTGYGLSLGPQSGYRENVITGNTDGTINGTGLVDLGNNACNGSTTCP